MDFSGISLASSRGMMKTLLLSISIVLSVGAQEYPHYFVNDSTQTSQKNSVQLLNSGMAALQKRVDLVRKAKERISLEYFIWEKDLSGLLLFHELIKRAKEGIEVRIILDKSITVVEMDEFIAEALLKHGIELRHYNRALDPLTAQMRTHRKIMVIDGDEGITGGRNIGDDYFAFDEEYNFLDRDIYIRGPVAKAMQDSFDDFWKNSIVKKPKKVDAAFTASRISRRRADRKRYEVNRGKQNEERRRAAEKWLEERDHIPEALATLEAKARPVLNENPVLSCPKLSFVSDLPGARGLTLVNDEYRSKYRYLRKALFNYIANETRGDYILASPYFMLNKDWQKLLSEVAKKEDVNPIIFTNSLGSTDAFYVASSFYHIAFKWQAAGLDLWVHNSRFDDLYPVLNDKVSSHRWGMHEKTQVFNDEAFYIGTYNIDNRSDILNVEMGVFCEGSKEATALLKEDMVARYRKGYQFVDDEKAIDVKGNEADIYGHASKGQIRLMRGFTPMALLLEPLM